jgi:hypothetical protein
MMVANGNIVWLGEPGVRRLNNVSNGMDLPYTWIALRQARSLPEGYRLWLVEPLGPNGGRATDFSPMEDPSAATCSQLMIPLWSISTRS